MGPAYGRKMMKGYLQACGLRVTGRRVGDALRDVAPAYHRRRQQIAFRQINPIPYFAEYSGHKIHIDQNEKLVTGMYGATHVLAVDGFSGFILGLITMPLKNNLVIYEQLFRPIMMHFGLWDQDRVDHGREFYLLLYVQEKLHHLRGEHHMYSRCLEKYVVNTVFS